MNIINNADINSDASERFRGLLDVPRLQEKMPKTDSDTWLQRQILGADDSTISIKERGK